VYLLDKNIDINDVTKENIGNKAVFLEEIAGYDCSSSYYDKIMTYKVTKH
jgi:hypothetical protein